MFYHCVDLVVFLYPSETGLRKIRDKGASHLLLPWMLPSVVWLHSTSSSKYLPVYSMKHLCAVDFKVYLMLKHMHRFLLVKFSTVVTGLRCYHSCITNMLSSFTCHAKNELKLWSSVIIPSAAFIFYLFCLSFLDSFFPCWFSMRLYLFLCWFSGGMIRKVGIRWGG